MRDDKVRRENKRFKMAWTVRTETSTYIQVVVTFVHKNAKLAHSHAQDVVKCCQSEAKPSPKGSVSVSSHSPCPSL